MTTQASRPAGIYLGERMRKDTLTGEEILFTGDEHVLLIGPTRSGKGRRLLAPNLILDTGRSALVIDPKGELAGWTAEYRQKAGHEVLYLDPFRVLTDDARLKVKSTGFNPLLALDPVSPDFVDDATGLAEALVMIEPQARDPHWAESAQELIAGLIMYVRIAYNMPAGVFAADTDWGTVRAPTLGEVRRLVTLPPPRFAKLVIAVTTLPEEHGEIVNKLSPYLQTGDNKELASIMSTARTQTRFLDSPSIAGDLQGGRLDFSALKQRLVTIYLVLPPARLVTHAKWLRLVVGSAIQSLQKTPRDPARPDVLFMLDEFPQLGRMECVETSMALNAGFGIKIWAVVQHLNQLVHQYAENWETFLSGGVIATFGPRDAFTSEYLSRLSGQEFVDVMGKSFTDQGRFTQTVNQQLLASLLPHDFRRMPQGMLIIFLPTREEGQVMRRSYAKDFADWPEIKRHIRTL